MTREGGVLFVAETMHRDFLNLRFTPSSFMQLEDVVMLESRTWNTLASEIKTSWSFYRKEGEDLSFIDRVDLEMHIYSASELVSLLMEAGWETVAAYGNLATQEPFGPWTGMNLVARAL